MLKSSKSLAALVLCLSLMPGLFAHAAENDLESKLGGTPKLDEPTESSADAHDFNVRVSPLGLIGDRYSVALDVKVFDGWTIGPVLNYLNYSAGDLNVKVTGLGVRANFYLGRPAFTDGLIVSPFANYVSVAASDKIASLPAEASETGGVFGASASYQWLWQNFNLNFGVGAAFSSVSKVTVKSAFDTTRSVNARAGDGFFFDLSAGWAF